ncbi:MAG: GDP-mannose 4,6-dehydratase, partial [Bacteroidota bacterium]
ALAETATCRINGDGTQTRAFTHVTDTVNALVVIGEKGEQDEYAISAKEVYSLNELAELYGLTPEYYPATKSTRSTGAEDTTKLEALDWQQQHVLSEYVRQNKKHRA